MSVATEMPRYKCHKEVWALKIAKIEGVIVTPEDKRYTPFEVGDDYLLKHKPFVGGYYVVYDDGYRSFSPAKAFEEGYKQVR
jgi:hypothetical protein